MEPGGATNAPSSKSPERRPMTMLLSLPRIDGEDSREIRALELHAALGRHIRQLDEDLLFVPSSDGKGSYLVQYGGSSAVERCNCMDFQVRGHETRPRPGRGRPRGAERLYRLPPGRARLRSLWPL